MAHAKRAVKIQKEISYPDNPNVAYAINNVGIAHGQLGQLNQAIVNGKQALSLLEKSLGKHHPHTSRVYANQAFYLYLSGNHRESSKYIQSAIDIREKVRGADDYLLGTYLMLLGHLFAKQQKYVQSEKILFRSLEIVSKYDFQESNSAWIYNELGKLYFSQSKFSEASGYFKKAKDYYKRIKSKKATSANDFGKWFIDPI